jgi:hypothetical protein
MFRLAGAAARCSLFHACNSKSLSASRLLLAHTAPFSSNVSETTRKAKQIYLSRELDRRASRTLSERYEEIILDRYKAAVPLCDQLCAAGVKPATEAGWFWAEANLKSDRIKCTCCAQFYSRATSTQLFEIFHKLRQQWMLATLKQACA